LGRVSILKRQLCVKEILAEEDIEKKLSLQIVTCFRRQPMNSFSWVTPYYRCLTPAALGGDRAWAEGNRGGSETEIDPAGGVYFSEERGEDRPRERT
jgi:hypothetical protein